MFFRGVLNLAVQLHISYVYLNIFELPNLTIRHKISSNFAINSHLCVCMCIKEIINVHKSISQWIWFNIFLLYAQYQLCINIVTSNCNVNSFASLDFVIIDSMICTMNTIHIEILKILRTKLCRHECLKTHFTL